MSAMQRELRLDRQPRHIECFDNSNLQGTFLVITYRKLVKRLDV